MIVVCAVVTACVFGDSPTNGAIDAAAVTDASASGDAGLADRKYVGPCRCLRQGSAGTTGTVSQAYYDEERKDSTTCVRSKGGGCPWREYKGDRTDPNCYGFDEGGYGYSAKFRCENRLAGSAGSAGSAE